MVVIQQGTRAHLISLSSMLFSCKSKVHSFSFNINIWVCITIVFKCPKFDISNCPIYIYLDFMQKKLLCVLIWSLTCTFKNYSQSVYISPCNINVQNTTYFFIFRIFIFSLDKICYSLVMLLYYQWVRNVVRDVHVHAKPFKQKVINLNVNNAEFIFSFFFCTCKFNPIARLINFGRCAKIVYVIYAYIHKLVLIPF